MYKLIPLDYTDIIKALSKIGYVNDHQHGSHIVLYLADKNKYSFSFGERKPVIRLVVPAHKPLGEGMVRTIIRELDLSVEEFFGLL